MHNVHNAGWGGVRPPGGGVEEEGWRVVSRVVLMLMLLVLVLGSADRCWCRVLLMPYATMLVVLGSAKWC